MAATLTRGAARQPGKPIVTGDRRLISVARFALGNGLVNEFPPALTLCFLRHAPFVNRSFDLA